MAIKQQTAPIIQKERENDMENMEKQKEKERITLQGSATYVVNMAIGLQIVTILEKAREKEREHTV